MTKPENSSEVTSLITPVGDLITSLTATTDERAALAVVLAHLQHLQPDSAELVLVDLPGCAPRDPRVVATWRDGHVLTDSREAAAIDLPDALWAAPPAPVYSAGPAAVLVPLYNAGHGGWLGALRLGWPGERAFAADERAGLALMMVVLAAHLGGLHTLQALRGSFAEREQLHDITRRLNLATTLEDRLRVLVQPAPAADEAEVALCTIESDAAGVPTWLNVISVLPARDRPSLSEIGARYHLPSIPFAALYLSSPDEPLMISEINSDPRIDDYARSLYAMSGTHATIVMALTLHGRWVGLLNITWPRPISLGAREQRLYQALSRQAALLLDNSLMLDRIQATLQAAQQQRQLLQTVLDHIPVGVLLLDKPTGRPVLANTAATRLLGPQLVPVTLEDPAPAAPYAIMFPDSDRQIPREQLASVRVATTGVTESEGLDIVAPGRDRIQLEVTNVPMFDERSVVTNVLVVFTDVTARKRAEVERLRLQDEAIHAQAVALAERSSPIIPITDDILVLPIVGSIDVDRGQQILGTILEGACQRRAHVVIIDITGVSTLDTQATAALTGAARALRLLGVESIISGIHPDVAQTMIELGANLDGIATCGTLQSAIQYALGRLGRKSLATR